MTEHFNTRVSHKNSSLMPEQNSLSNSCFIKGRQLIALCSLRAVSHWSTGSAECESASRLSATALMLQTSNRKGVVCCHNSRMKTAVSHRIFPKRFSIFSCRVRLMHLNFEFRPQTTILNFKSSKWPPQNTRIRSIKV